MVDESGMGTDPLPPDTQTTTVVLDTTAPVITIVSPVPNTLFDSDDMSLIDYSVEDGTNGSGIASNLVTLDGGVASDGQILDMFLLNTGTHVIHVTTVDNLGNGSEATWQFRMQATSASLVSNIERGYQLGLIRNFTTYYHLRSVAVMALIPHQTGNHRLEWHRLDTMIDVYRRYRGTSVDRAFADKMIKQAQEIIDRRG